MGVLGLVPFLQKAYPNVLKVIPDRFRELYGKTVVFDGTLITQRFHFAPMPQSHRHVLGWYRMLEELKECGVSAICVFDGKERSLAKQFEVARRRDARKLLAARGRVEIDRLKRLLMLNTIMKTWGMLSDREKESTSRTFREATLRLKPIRPLPLPASNFFDPPQPTGVLQHPPQFASQNYQERDHRSLHCSPSTPHDMADEFLEAIPSHENPSADGEALSGLIEDIEPDIVSLASPNEEAPGLPDVGEIGTTLTALYTGYRASLERLRSLLQTTSQSFHSKNDGTDDSTTEYLMSKTQARLIVEEGTFWAKLEDFTLVQEDASQQAADLVQKSRLLSDSYARRTNPPTTQTYNECKEIIRAMGISCIETDGPFEAEALAASIVLHGQADFVGSEDTDVLVYGAPLMRNIAKKTDPLIILYGSDIRTALQLDQDQFIDFALLLGTDFSRRIKNVGPNRALKFIREYGSIEEILQREPQYPPREALALYLQQVEVARTVFHTLPPVPDTSTLQNQEPDDTAVQEILHRYGLWTELSHDYDWSYANALSGNYFDDNPAAA
ncbi:hypothetical protein PHLGIDRAFT_62434 [Phlebiopsis gigantea 11061_1 CR5-6]|uniref:XPG-I domain-containing protein n=1 Tax=Phlebiopsis gigantea (strain 11061_1 CR5-6) TaxID=745531 RepID=A0A0C3S6Z8_PHLG1|nr:hypothetical protein PHLGIDRAFT_62434 [Phlebiopsis gigantea 11061_1 CR5-6]